MTYEAGLLILVAILTGCVSIQSLLITLIFAELKAHREAIWGKP